MSPVSPVWETFLAGVYCENWSNQGNKNRIDIDLGKVSWHLTRVFSLKKYWFYQMDTFIEINLSIFLEKAMAPHSSTLAWKIPWMEEPVRLQSMGSLRVGHDWATSLSFFTFLHWRGKWQPTPVFLPGESQGRGSLVGCRLWGHTESYTTEAT